MFHVLNIVVELLLQEPHVINIPQIVGRIATVHPLAALLINKIQPLIKIIRLLIAIIRRHLIISRIVILIDRIVVVALRRRQVRRRRSERLRRSRGGAGVLRRVRVLESSAAAHIRLLRLLGGRLGSVEVVSGGGGAAAGGGGCLDSLNQSGHP